MPAGRPPKFSPLMLDQLKKKWGVRSARDAQRKVYMMRAARILNQCLAEMPEFRWLFDPSQRGRRALRRVLLAELGRIEDPGDFVQVAAYLCRNKHSNEESVYDVRCFIAKLKQARAAGDPIDAEFFDDPVCLPQQRSGAAPKDYWSLSRAKRARVFNRRLRGRAFHTDPTW